MAYDIDLAARVRAYLKAVPDITVEEKRMFGGLAFLVNGKMCINVSGDSLMCRFDPANLAELSRWKGFRPMVMRGKTLPGYCYVGPEGFSRPDDFSYWVELCLRFNGDAKASKTRR